MPSSSPSPCSRKAIKAAPNRAVTVCRLNDLIPRRIFHGGTAKNYAEVFPEGVHAILTLERAIRASGLEPSLLDLIRIRTSQLNGCAYCIDRHTKDARARGETEQRIYALNAWRETQFFTPRERSALAWTGALTNIQEGHAPDAVYQEARGEFDEAGLVKLTLAIAQINTWNRIAIGFRAEPGTYQPARHDAARGSMRSHIIQAAAIS